MASEQRQWLEINAAPLGSPTELLQSLVDPLVHDLLAGAWRRWFYFWEPDLRLRFQWHSADDAATHTATVARALNAAVADGRIRSWFEGTHGRRGLHYAGEAETYGQAVWDLVSADWMSGSELALTLSRLQSDGGLEGERGLDFQWSRRVHLFSNQLGKGLVDEARSCLRQAAGYLKLAGHANDDAQRRLLEAIDGYFVRPGGQPSELVVSADADGLLTATMFMPDPVSVRWRCDEAGTILWADSTDPDADVVIQGTGIEVRRGQYRAVIGVKP